MAKAVSEKCSMDARVAYFVLIFHFLPHRQTPYVKHRGWHPHDPQKVVPTHHHVVCKSDQSSKVQDRVVWCERGMGGFWSAKTRHGTPPQHFRQVWEASQPPVVLLVRTSGVSFPTLIYFPSSCIGPQLFCFFCAVGMHHRLHRGLAQCTLVYRARVCCGFSTLKTYAVCYICFSIVLQMAAVCVRPFKKSFQRN